MGINTSGTLEGLYMGFSLAKRQNDSKRPFQADFLREGSFWPFGGLIPNLLAKNPSHTRARLFNEELHVSW